MDSSPLMREYFSIHIFVMCSPHRVSIEQAIYIPSSHIHLTPGQPERHQVNPHRKCLRFLPQVGLEPWILVVGDDGANHYTKLASHIHLTPGPPERHQVNPHRKCPRSLPQPGLELCVLVVGGDGANHYTNLGSYLNQTHEGPRCNYM